MPHSSLSPPPSGSRAQDTRLIVVVGTRGRARAASALAAALSRTRPVRSAGPRPFSVVTADEGDRCATPLAPEVTLVLDAEVAHRTHAERHTFKECLDRVAPSGAWVVSADSPLSRRLTRYLRSAASTRVVTYGFSEGADVRVLDAVTYGPTLRIRVVAAGDTVDFTVPATGDDTARLPDTHRAVAALAAGHALGLDTAEFANALGRPRGTDRGLTPHGEAGGVTVVRSDARHPTEMAADLQALREMTRGAPLLAVYQPGRAYGEQHLGTAMGHALTLADASLVLDPSGAGPRPQGTAATAITSETVVDAAVSAGSCAFALRDAEAAPGFVSSLVSPGDVVVTMGDTGAELLAPKILAALERSGEDRRR
ncbi:UDP-N-acetylmuramate--L-alanine ligase [Streptomyces sp. NPDC001941]|uniref:glutamate ligase domain-containing protein n=1 Tax=Streptomyces sp. NPDC001941 TaxID=3154659 RepID=UPI00331AB37A